jgi:hypothetical protein
MLKLTRPPVASEGEVTRRKGVDTLHAACLTLVRTSPDLIRSMNVLVPLADFPIAATSLVDLAERISAEYGLIAEPQLKERHLAVRILRCTDEAAARKDR